MESNLESLNSKNNGSNSSNSNNFFHMLSFLSWALILSLQLNIYYSGKFIWTAVRVDFVGFVPIRIDFQFLQTYFVIITFFGFITFLLFTTIKNNQNVYDGMFGKFSKFHFLPLLLICALIINLNELSNNYSTDEKVIKYNKTILSFNMVFTILSLASLIFIYINTELNSEWYIVLAIKKCFYSSFIILLWYNFFFDIFFLRVYDIFDQYIDDDTNFEDTRKSYINFNKGTGISFPIIFGIGAFAFSFIFKDLMAVFLTFLMYLGMILGFFGRNGPTKDTKEEINGNAEGIIYIIFMALSLCLIVFLVLKFKDKLF